LSACAASTAPANWLAARISGRLLARKVARLARCDGGVALAPPTAGSASPAPDGRASPSPTYAQRRRGAAPPSQSDALLHR
jgi:hypothetical protein